LQNKETGCQKKKKKSYPENTSLVPSWWQYIAGYHFETDITEPIAKHKRT
jgi:hypothetical protein